MGESFWLIQYWAIIKVSISQGIANSLCKESHSYKVRFQFAENLTLSGNIELMHTGQRYYDWVQT